MLHARIKYMGETKKAKGDRIALLICSVSEEAKLLRVLTLINAEYPEYRFDNLAGDDREVEYFVRVDDKEEFQEFSNIWKEYKKMV